MKNTKAIHIRQVNGSYAPVAPPAKQDREVEREFARLTMYEILSNPQSGLTYGLPLAQPRCDGIHCPPVPRMKIDRKSGGLQPRVVAPALVRNPKRLASSIVSQWTPPLYHKFFCAHDRFRGLPCPTCGRTASEGREFLATVIV